MADSISLGSVFATLELETSKWTASVNEIKTGMSTASTSIGSGVANISSSLNRVAGAMAIPAAGITYLGGKILGMGMDFEESMAKVAAVSGVKANETDESFKRLQDTAIQLGIDTRFSANEAAEGLYELASAGMSVDESIATLPNIIDLATASQMGLGDTSLLVVNLLSSFERSGLDAAHASDVLAKGVNSSTLHFEDLQESLPFVAGAFGQLGLGIEDAVTSLGILSDSGIKGGRAGEYLRQAISSLVDPTKQGTDVMKELGIITADGANQLFDAEGKMKSFDQILQIFTDSTAGLTEQQRLQSLGQIFQVQGAQAMNTLIQKGTGTFNEYKNALVNSDGAAREMAEAMNQTVRFSIDQLGSSIEALGVKLNTQLKPYIGPIVDAFTSLVNKITEFASSHPEVVGVIAALAGSFVVVAAIAAIIAGLVSFFAAIGSFLLPVAGIVAGIAAAFIFLKTHMEFVNRVIDYLKNAWATLLPYIIQAKDIFLSLLLPVLIGIKDKLMELWTLLEPKLIPALKMIGIVILALVAIVAIIIAAFVLLVAAIVYAIVWIYTQMMTYSKMTEDTFKNAWNGIKDFFTTWWEAFSSFWTNVWNTARDFFVNLFNGIKDFFIKVWNDIYSFIYPFIYAMYEIFRVVFNLILYVISVVWNSVHDTTMSIWNSIWGFLKPIIDTIKGYFESVWNGIRNFFSGVWNNMRDTVNDVMSWISTKVMEVWNSLSERVSGPLEAMKSKISEAFEGVKTKVNEIVRDAYDWGKNLIDGFVRGIKDFLYKVGDVASDIADKIEGMIGFHSPTREGPGRYADQWMPNLFNMMNSQIQDFAPKIGEAFSSSFSGADSVRSGNSVGDIKSTYQFFGPVNMQDDKTLDALTNKIGERLMNDFYPAKSGGI